MVAAVGREERVGSLRRHGDLERGERELALRFRRWVRVSRGGDVVEAIAPKGDLEQERHRVGLRIARRRRGLRSLQSRRRIARRRMHVTRRVAHVELDLRRRARVVLELSTERAVGDGRAVGCRGCPMRPVPLRRQRGRRRGRGGRARGRRRGGRGREDLRARVGAEQRTHDEVERDRGGAAHQHGDGTRAGAAQRRRGHAPPGAEACVLTSAACTTKRFDADPFG